MNLKRVCYTEMSENIPQPPPPLMIPHTPSQVPIPPKITRQTTFVTQISSTEDIRLAMYERLKKNVQRRDGKKVVVSVNKEVTPVLQDGPSCGLVAVVMAAQSFGINLTFDYIFNAAKDRGFTRQGEMFSANDMKILVEDLIDSTVVTSLDMNEDTDVLVQHLIRGGLCLIPYDSDFNHEPCNKRGHKAHWALLTGCGLIIDTSVCSSKGLTTEDGCVFTASSDTVLSHNLLTESEDILVYGLQGKSQYPGVWSLSSLIASNRNLVEVDPNRKDEDIGFILPQEGIDKALCSKALLLSIQNKK